MSATETGDPLLPSPVLPVVTVTRADDGPRLAEALLEGGIGAIEITLRTSAAWGALEAVAGASLPIRLGLGSARRGDDLRRAADLGLDFAVSPGLTPELALAWRNLDLALIPGVATVSEAMAAADLGLERLKFFPAEAAGGVPWLQAVAGPLPDLRFCPTGGIGPTNRDAYLSLPNVLCVGGSWVAPAHLVEARDWAAITDNARRALS